nr:retrovirus-related Pol polyprotein from transposon TNT 1-94 [Tanacetum cinerariifolium]
MRPFRCPVTILNTIDHLGKFNRKADEGFFVGYSTNSKVFRVFNSRTKTVEENLHVKFSKNTPNIAKSGPNWLFDIDALTKSMNYKPVVVGNQSNGSTSTKAYDNVVYGCADDLNITDLEEIGRFGDAEDDDSGVDMTNWIHTSKNMARLVAQVHTQEEGIDYDKVFAPVARIEAIRLFLACASFKDFVVY